MKEFNGIKRGRKQFARESLNELHKMYKLTMEEQYNFIWNKLEVELKK